MKVTLDKGTELMLNGAVLATLPSNTVFEFPCNSEAHAAELCAAAKIKVDWDHKEMRDGKNVLVRYGANGKEFVDEIPKPKAEVKAEVKVQPKVEIKPKVEAKPVEKVMETSKMVKKPEFKMPPPRPIIVTKAKPKKK